MKINTLEDLLTDELKDLYSAENQILKALPKLAKAADSSDLRNAFQKHLDQTRTQVRRIEQICTDLDIRPGGKKCLGMEGLVEEGKEVLQEQMEKDPRQAALIGAAQRVEHYEIAAYGTAMAHAKQLGYMKVVDLLAQSLEEEKQANELLTSIAENRVNVKAAMNTGG
jgi:ferritin-like metal-binding protein YciE